MTQRLDDVTGDPIRLSASQREQQRQGMIAMLNAQTRQINTLTAHVRALETDAAALRADIETLRHLLYAHTGPIGNLQDVTEGQAHVLHLWAEPGWRNVLRRILHGVRL